MHIIYTESVIVPKEHTPSQFKRAWHLIPLVVVAKRLGFHFVSSTCWKKLYCINMYLAEISEPELYNIHLSLFLCTNRKDPFCVDISYAVSSLTLLGFFGILCQSSVLIHNAYIWRQILIKDLYAVCNALLWNMVSVAIYRCHIVNWI